MTSGGPIKPGAVLADTSFLLAVMDRRSREHGDASNLYDSFPDPILIPSITLAELVYLLNRSGGKGLVIKAIQAIRQSQMILVDPDVTDYDRAVEILSKYDDTRIDFVDACIMALAERLKVTRILTFDHRDFGIYRPAHIERFDLLP